MQTTHLMDENAVTSQKLKPCCECGWPGVGNLPTGVRTLNGGGGRVLFGQLSYFFIRTELCSVCQEMLTAVENRPWFVEAHHEYLDQIELKKQLLAGRCDAV